MPFFAVSMESKYAWYWVRSASLKSAVYGENCGVDDKGTVFKTGDDATEFGNETSLSGTLFVSDYL